MKKLILSLVFLLTASTAFLQSKTETRKLQEIKKLEIYGKTFVAELIKGEENKIEISSSDLALDKVVTSESNGELKITVKGFNSGNVTCKIYCTTIPASISINNGALIKSTEKLQVGQISLTTNSDGYIHLILESENITAVCNSGGDMTLEGSTQTLSANANTNATLRTEMMTVDNATAKAYLGAEVHVSVKNNLTTVTGTNGKVHVYKPYATNIAETNETGGQTIRE